MSTTKQNAVTLSWGTPPPSKRGRRSKWLPILEQVKTKPNEWAKVGEFSVSTAGALRKQYGALGFEFTSRGTSKGRADLWVRYTAKAKVAQKAAAKEKA